MKKIFISQPMHGMEESDILQIRQDIINAVEKTWDDVYILDSFLTGAKDVNPLVCLGHAITILSKADIAVFAPHWSHSRGCRIEHEICEDYGITRYKLIESKAGYLFVKENDIDVDYL